MWSRYRQEVHKRCFELVVVRMLSHGTSASTDKNPEPELAHRVGVRFSLLDYRPFKRHLIGGKGSHFLFVMSGLWVAFLV